MSAPDQGALAAVSPSVEADAGACDSALAEVLKSLHGALGAAWWLVDSVSASVTGGPNLPADRLPAHWLALCGEVARRGKIEFIGDEEPLLGLAVPIPDIPNCSGGDSRHVAVGLFLSTAALADRAAADRRAMTEFAATASVGSRPMRSVGWPNRCLGRPNDCWRWPSWFCRGSPDRAAIEVADQ